MSAKTGVVLDAGAFIALERRDPVMTHLVRRFSAESTPLVTSAGVVAQVWRGGVDAQVPVAYLLRRTRVADLTHASARILGRMLGATGTRDPIDAHIVLLAREHGWPVITSDPDELRTIDSSLEIQTI